ncbi:MAG TPA: sigma-70 family RNA polymerase sigma factor [Ktedonobacteraceae bacterium]|nr:sigma-70 family RNA polymerase sigma factor [Ktedonobacteraceae bacterium]
MMPAAQAVELLIDEYGKLVFQTIYGLTGDWEESQDLTQDTFHQALKSIDAARAKSGVHFHAKAWLLQIALNTVRMQRRRRNIFRFVPFSRLQKEVPSSEFSSRLASIDILNEQAAPVQPVGYGITEDIDPDSFIAEQDAVRRSLARLSEPLRLCLLLSIVGQFSTREIAQMLDIEEAAVRQRLGRARKQFQSLYEHESDEEIIDTSEITYRTQMSQKRLPDHHSNTERAKLRLPG